MAVHHVAVIMLLAAVLVESYNIPVEIYSRGMENGKMVYRLRCSTNKHFLSWVQWFDGSKELTSPLHINVPDRLLFSDEDDIPTFNSWLNLTNPERFIKRIEDIRCEAGDTTYSGVNKLQSHGGLLLIFSLVAFCLRSL